MALILSTPSPNRAKFNEIFTLQSTWGGGGGTLDFEVSRHLSEESGITQQLYMMGWGKYTFSESPLRFGSANVDFKSVGAVTLIFSPVMSHSYRNTPVFT